MSFYPAGSYKIGRRKGAKRVSELASGYNFFPDMIDHHYADYVGRVGEGISIPKDTKNVTIVGGGITGLTIGIELIRSGVNVKIYEGSDRVGKLSKKDADVGGRFCTSTIFSPDNKYRFSAEMGAMRFPIDSKVFWKYFQYALTTLKTLPPEIKDRDPVLYPFPNSGIVPTAILFKGTLYTYEFGVKDLPDKFRRVRGKVNMFINRITTECPFNGGGITLEQVANWCKTDIRDNERVKEKIQWFWSQMIARYDGRSFGDVIRGIGLTAEELEVFYYLGLGTGGFGPLYPISFLEILRLSIWNFSIEYALPITTTQFAGMLKDLLYAEKCSDAKPSWGKATWIDWTVVGVGRSPNNKLLYAIRNRDTPESIQVRSDAQAFVVATSHRAYTTSLNLDAPYKAFVGQEIDLGSGAFSWKGDNAISPYHKTLLDATVTSMKTLHTLSSSKFFCVLKKPWIDDYWPTVAGRPVRVILSDTLSMQMYWLDQNPDSQDILCLATYLWGDECRKNQANNKHYTPKQVGVQGRLAICRVLAASLKAYSRVQDADNPDPSKDITYSTLYKAFQTINSEQQIEDVVWEDEPLIHTSFKLAYPGEIGNTMSLVYQFQMATDNFLRGNDYSNIFLAGESCSFYGGWAEGAMVSSINAAAGVLMSITNNEKSPAPAFNIANTLPRYGNYNLSKENIVLAVQTPSSLLSLVIFIQGKNLKTIDINIASHKVSSHSVKQIALKTVYTTTGPRLLVACSVQKNKLLYGVLDLDTYEWSAVPKIIPEVEAIGYLAFSIQANDHYIFYQAAENTLRRYGVNGKNDTQIADFTITDYLRCIDYPQQSITALFTIDSHTTQLQRFRIITINNNDIKSAYDTPIQTAILDNTGGPIPVQIDEQRPEIITSLSVSENGNQHFLINCSYSTLDAKLPITSEKIEVKAVRKKTDTSTLYIFGKKINNTIHLFYQQTGDPLRVMIFNVVKKAEALSVNILSDRPYFAENLALGSTKVLEIEPITY